MSLATRCPACGTVFRVVKDQLRVSEGWVRCGRCSEVFNAVEQLVEVPAAPAGSTPAAQAQAPQAQAPHSELQAPSPPAQTRLEADDEDHFPATQTADLASWHARDEPAAARSAFDEAPETVTATPAVSIEIDDDERRPLRAPPGAAIETVAAGSPLLTTARDDGLEEPAPAVAEPQAEPALATPPSFMREDPPAPSQRPGMRRALMAGVVLAALVLAGQALFEYRHWAAARWPALAPGLQAACQALGCRIEAPRWIDPIVVESSGLVRVNGSAHYRFNAVMRNRSNVPLAMPAVDLTLTDTRGQVISRRVLTAGELGVNARQVAAGAEVPLAGLLTVRTTSGAAVQGYTIEFFYP